MDTSYSKQKYSQLNNGTKMPRSGYGTWQEQENIEALVKEAVKVGYRHIDTAKGYNNEASIGKALKEVLSNGTVKREDLYIVTKIWNSDKVDVEKTLKESLERLQLDYIDLYLIHWPIGEVDAATGKVKKQVPLHVTWKALEDQVKAGRVKSIGVSNFNVQLLLDLLSYAEIKPVCNQIELHPYNTQEDMVGFCKKNDIEVVAYSPLGGNVPWNTELSSKSLVEDPTIKELATKYNKTPAQIIINWHLSRGYVVIPKTSTISRIKENFESDTFDLSPEDAKKITALNKNFRVCDPKNLPFFGHIPMFA